jgi:hypothetical protein
MRLITYIFLVILLFIALATEAQIDIEGKTTNKEYQKEADKQAKLLLDLLDEHGDVGVDKFFEVDRNKDYYGLNVYVDETIEPIMFSIYQDKTAYFHKKEVSQTTVGIASNDTYYVVLIFAF